MTSPQQAQIQVRYVNAAKVGKKYGTIVDTGGNRYPVAAAFVDLFHVNDNCTVTYEPTKWGDNFVNLVVGKNGVMLHDLAAGKHSSPPHQAQPAPSPQPQQAPGRTAWDAERQKAKEIFCTGTLQKAIEAGTIKDPNEIEGWLGYIVDAWEVCLEGKRPRGTMNSGSPPGQTYPGMDDGPPVGDPRFQDPLG